MPYTCDFDLVIPRTAIFLQPDELLPGLRDFLLAVGIDKPSRYAHYQIRIIIKPRFIVHSDEKGLAHFFSRRTELSRKNKRRAFSSVDSVFVTLTKGHDEILFREVYPPTTNREGRPELALGASLTVGAGGAVSGTKAAAEVHAKIKKEFRFRDYTVVTQRNDATALWDFRHSWFEDGRQPEVCVTCSVPKKLDVDSRFVLCQPRVTADGREVLAPKGSKKIVLPVPT